MSISVVISTYNNPTGLLHVPSWNALANSSTRKNCFGHRHWLPTSTESRGKFSSYSVRGPLTARALNIPLRKSIGDSAFLCLTTDRFKELFTLKKKYRVSVIPHHQTATTIDWETIGKVGELHFIDPRKDFFRVFEDIAQSECVLTESLHGAIFADALRTAWQPFRMGHRFNMFKWHD